MNFFSYSAFLPVALFFLLLQPAGAQTPNPNPPTGLRVTSAGEAGISLSWSTPADDGHGAIAAYNVYRCVEGASACEPQWYTWLDSAGGTTYTDTGVAAGTTYRYAVDSMRYLGGEPGEKSRWSNQVTATAGTAPPPQPPDRPQPSQPNPPTGMRVTSAAATGISLSWSTPADDGYGAIAAYNVYRCVEGASACEPQWYTWLDSVGGTSYTDTDMTAGRTYRYAVDSMRYLGGEPGEKSRWSNQVTAMAGAGTGPPAPVQAPAPTGLQVTAAGETGISLSWTAPVDDDHGALLGYNVYRCEEGETACEPQWLVWVDGAATTSYTDGAVTAGTTYRYAVGSSRGAGTESAWSNQVTAGAGLGQEGGDTEFSCGGDENQEVDGSDLITNGGFENGNSGWNVWGGASIVSTSEGSSALMVTENNGAEQTVTGLQPNTRYTLTGSGKVTGPNAMTIGVKEHGSNEEYMQFTSSNYATGSIIFTTGLAGTSAIIYVYKYAGAEAGCGDNIILTQGSGSEYTLEWSDEFNGSGAVDPSKWRFENGFVRNEEQQWYQPDNAFQEGGNLVIEGRRQTFANPDYVAGSNDWRTNREFINYTSASLITKQSWKYSKIVVRAKVTNHTGTWPAIWTLGTSCEWPSNGEVDIMENYGGNILANFAWGSNTRWQPTWDSSRHPVNSLGSDWADDFHTWEFDWDENRMSIYVDGVLLNDRPSGNTINGSAACAGQNPFKQSHNLLLNLALGGSQGGSVDNLAFPTRYLVDYVRVYSVQQEGDDQTTSPAEEEPIVTPVVTPTGHPLVDDAVPAEREAIAEGNPTTPGEEDTMSPSPEIASTFIQQHHQVKKAIDEFEDAPGGTTWAEAMNADSGDEEAAPRVLSFRSRADEAVLGGTFIDKYQYLERGNWDFISDPGGTTWTGTAWQGERVHAPLVVWANDSAWQGTLEYEMSDLTGERYQVIPGDRVRLLFPTYVTADPERRGCDGYATRADVAPVYLADALSATPAPVALPGEPFKVWLAIDVPEATQPGSYRGLFVVRDPAPEHAAVSFSVNLVVQDHRLPPPSAWQFELNVWQHPEWVLRHYNAAHPEALIERWSAAHYDLLEGSYRLLGEAGQKWVTATLKDGAHGAPGMVTWTRTREDGHDWRFDFAAFGAHVERLMGWGIGPGIEAFGILGWNRDEIPYWSEQRRQVRVLDAPVGSAAHTAAWQAFLPAFRAYLEERGWFAQTWLSMDESDAATLRVLVELIRADDPDWNIAVSYFATDLPADVLELAQATNIYLGIAAQAGLPNTAETVRTLYTSCADGSRVNSFITPDSNPAEVEWLTWYAGKLDRDGYSRWAYDYWRATEPLNMRRLSFTSGDTALVYRTSNDSDLEAMTSLRLELLRYGIQQSEKRRILRELYSRCRYTTGPALIDELVGDDFISLERAGNGLVRADLVRAHEQLDIVSAAAQALAGGCR